MGIIEFELQKVVNAPADQVFTRLADINGHNDWMPAKGSIRKHSEQTSPGAPGPGTTYVDQTKMGEAPGEIEVFEPSRRLVYHWWDQGRGGRLKYEGWPAYTLEEQADGTTLVRHDARIQTYGIYNLAVPMFRVMAKKERTVTLGALAASFD
ncbi:SRPBCC family protein [Nocardioides marmorisolisilvae]|nr:SRPBCC family protein [Nocardioides marmorisolisilvae]